jgi:hypothetical protein
MVSYGALLLSNFYYFCPYMRVTVFIICLFYLLLGGYNYVYTGAHHKSYWSELHIKKNHQAKFTKKNPGSPVVKEASPDQGDAFFIAEDVEDEDTNNLSARKYKLLARSFYTDPNTVILTHLYSRYKAPRPIHGFLSNKYITQRALRI